MLRFVCQTQKVTYMRNLFIVLIIMYLFQNVLKCQVEKWLAKNDFFKRPDYAEPVG